MLDESVVGAGAVGNNAAWNCPCGHPVPLVGSLVIAVTVDCPTCESRYRVVSDAPAGPPVGCAVAVEQEQVTGSIGTSNQPVR